MTRDRFVIVMSLVFAVFANLAFPFPAVADPYFNSSEPGCNPSSPNPNYVLCDDFDQGKWAATCNEPNSPNNNGWLLCNSTWQRTPPPPAVTCAGAGAGGTNCAATSTLLGGDGGNAQLGMHGFYPNNAVYDELYIRFYLKMSAGYQFNNNQKFISFIRSAYQGGIDLGGAFTRRLSELYMAAGWDCDDNNYRNPQNPAGSWCYLAQNQGNKLTLQPGRWYYVEFHVKNNTYNVRDGIARVWADDCGVDGRGCTGAPTLRSKYTNVGWRGQGAGSPPSPSPSGAAWGTPTTPLMGSMWFDIWGNPSDVGTILIDQLIVSRAGPVGPMGAAPVAQKPPPSPPSALRVQ
jgi:hypothetical protein